MQQTTRDDMEQTDVVTKLSVVDLFADLQTRAENLLAEFRSYQAHLKSRKKQQEVDVRTFKRGIESEVKTLQKLTPDFAQTADYALDGAEGEVEGGPQLHALRSSNLPFYEAVWESAR